MLFHRLDFGEKQMRKLIFALLLVPGIALAGEKDQCTIQDSGGGATLIACKDYVITKTPRATTICRLPSGSPEVYCQTVRNP